MKKNVLVTGSEGFLGKAASRGLEARGYRVSCLDKRKGFDVTSYEATKRALLGKEAVVHLGSPCSSLMFSESPRASWLETVRGMANVLEHSSGRILIASTCTLYGDSSSPVSESHELPAPPNLYAAAKIECERLALLNSAHGGDIKILRIFSGYGPDEWEKGAYASPVMHFIRTLLRGGKPTVYGDGRQTRDFIFVEDIVEFIARALETRSKEIIFNVGSSRATSFLALLDIIQERVGFRSEINFTSPPIGYVPSIVADTSLAARELGYSSRVSLEEGVAATIEEYSKECDGVVNKSLSS